MSDLKQLQALAQTQVRDLRTFLHSMRPVDVDGANLVATARRAAESFQKESGIPVTFLGTNTPVGLPPGDDHSRSCRCSARRCTTCRSTPAPRRVAVAMEKTDRGLEISVDDNGHGFDFAGSYSLEELELLRLGPASLKRRARSLNADLLLESRPGRGAGIKFRIPLHSEHRASARAPRPAIVPLFCSACGRYADFTLPPLPAATLDRDLPLSAETPAPVLPARCRFPDALNPSVVRHATISTPSSTARLAHRPRHHPQTAVHWQPQGIVLSPDPRTWEGTYIAANGSASPSGHEFWYWYEAGPRDRLRIGPRPLRSAHWQQGARARPRPRPLRRLGRARRRRPLRHPHRAVLLHVLPRPGPRRPASASASPAPPTASIGKSSAPIPSSKWRARRLRRERPRRARRLAIPRLLLDALHRPRRQARYRHLGLARSTDGVHWTRLPARLHRRRSRGIPR